MIFSQEDTLTSDSLLEAFPALRKSCQASLTQTDPLSIAMQPFCHAVLKAPPLTHAAFKDLLQSFLTPCPLNSDQQNPALFTGYYEPQLQGSYTKEGPYQVPLYRVPEIQLDRQRSRHAISKGALAGKAEPLVWVSDKIDAFFLEIQGSGRVLLEDQTVLQLNYAGQNGHPYTPIGRTLVKEGHLPLEKTSLQTIKAWLRQNLDQVDRILNTNASYVFFQKRPELGAIGTQGVVLTPQRSLAVDPQHIPLGVPVWVESKGKTVQNRLMIAQDTGGAIKGSHRLDYFWGYGQAAEEQAGEMKDPGTYTIFLPKEYAPLHGQR